MCSASRFGVVVVVAFFLIAKNTFQSYEFYISLCSGHNFLSFAYCDFLNH